MKRILIALWTAVPAVLAAQGIAPALVSTCGNTFTTSNAMLEWSAGECAIATYTAPTFLLTEGFHQPNLLTTAVSEAAAGDWEAWPNPVTDVLHLRTSYAIAGPLHFRLFNSMGQAVMQWDAAETDGEKESSGQSPRQQWHVSLGHLAEGAYILQAATAGLPACTWHIVKLTGH
jgi:hypothetical protein